MLKAVEPGGIAIIGYGCRLPGAADPEAFRQLLLEGRSAVTELPPDRFPADRWLGEGAGRSVTFAAGRLESPWDFDPGFFGVAPREAEQMDPQQRLLLQVAWEALEHARRPVSSLEKDRTGVFIGASSSDHSNRFHLDPAGMGPNFMTGNTLSILSNRISYLLDLHGPSWTVDTACSSGLYALRAAAAELGAGRIDTALVGGVNMLLSPWPFAGFSQASMLSRKGRCAAFDAGGDGYVRAEGAVVFALRRLSAALADGDEVLGVIEAIGVNSDGRTPGISLPSGARQLALLQEVYGELGLHPDRLAFVEAHGTGTRAGDPQEAHALGEALGKRRVAPLPIGSAKTNVGHLEAGAGLVGLLKAQLALEHGVLPPSLHFESPNPDIDFDRLNLRVATAPLPLPASARPWHAGVNAFGFGGANAHCCLRQPRPEERRSPGRAAPTPLILSARSEESLRALARTMHDRLRQDPDPSGLAAVCAWERERLPLRLVVPERQPAAQAEALAAWLSAQATVEAGADAPPPQAEHGASAPEEGRAESGGEGLLFLYSGNGAQHVGMGRAAHADPAFRAGFEAAAAAVESAGGPDLAEALFAKDLAPRLRAAALAQPLIFAVQVGVTRALAARGIAPAAALGHSVGEIGASWAAGAFPLDAAARLILQRSEAQEAMRGKGGMAVLLCDAARAEALIAALGAPGLAVAADNSGRAATISGPDAAVDAACAAARAQKIAVRRLDLDYPFHSAAADPLESGLIDALAFLRPEETRIPYLSAVFGRRADGQELGPRYWWANIRRPVLFRQALGAALALRPAAVMEIGPRPVLLGFAREEIRALSAAIPTLASLEADVPADFDRIAARALAHGAPLDDTVYFGPRPRVGTRAPLYPWRNRPYRADPTPEALGGFEPGPASPLLGRRDRADGREWRAHLSATRPAWLGDHRVDGTAVMPAAGFAEIALSAALEGLDGLEGDGAAVELVDFDVLRPLSLDDGEVELRTRLHPGGAVEIAARRRLSEDPFALHARGAVRRSAAARPADLPAAALSDAAAAQVYKIAAGMGLDYGPAFQRVRGFEAEGPGAARLAIAPSDAMTGAALDPAALDGALHGLLALLDGDAEHRMLPVRIGALRLHLPHARIHGARVEALRRSARGLVARIALMDGAGRVAAELPELRLREAPSRRRPPLDDLFLRERWVPITPSALPLETMIAAEGETAPGPAAEESALLRDALARDAAWSAAASLVGEGGALDPAPLLADGRLSAQAEPLWRRIEAALGGGPVLAPRDGPSPDAAFEALFAAAPGEGARLLDAAGLEARVRATLASGLEEAAAEASGGSGGLLSSEMSRACARLLDAAPAGMRVALLGRLEGDGASTLDAALRRAGEVWRSDPDPAAARAVGAASPDAASLGSFDIVITLDCLHRGGVRLAARLLRSGGVLIAAEGAPDLLEDLHRGCAPGWLSSAGLGPRRSRAGWEERLRREGLRPGPCCGAGLICAEAQGVRASLAAEENAVSSPLRRYAAIPLHSADPGPLRAALGDAACCDRVAGGAQDGAASGARDPAPLHLLPVASASDPQTALQEAAALCAALRAAALSAAGRKGASELWVVDPDPHAPRAAALRAFLRCAGNELPDLAPRWLGMQDADWQAAAALLRDPPPDRELLLRDGRVWALRVDRAPQIAADARRAAAPADAAMRLEQTRPGALDALRWTPSARIAPGPGEIEIEVAAAGLNFRDLMWAQGLLPEEALEDGFAGPGLGMECAGRVLRVGEGAGIAPGAWVSAFARDAFASHVIAPAHAAAPLPPGVGAQEAATIPVAFLTAWHGLIGLAGLQAGERVLIHGGAGGVGLAAVQVALAVGAEVIATAGAPPRRALLRRLGCIETHDSRDLAFADALQGEQGVDVVLNALSGEAMQRSLECLRPFGRFVELGKRDYYGGGAMALRPFRRNLSYFGVDVDQLLNGRPAAAARAMQAVAEGFARGDYTPLPCTVHDPSETERAFRRLQRSGHLGKLLLRPPEAAPLPGGRRLPDGGAALVVGGLGGFGARTAQRLAARGVRDLWVTSRSGVPAPGAEAALEAARACGARVHACAADAADPEAMAALLARIRSGGAPLRAVIHAAAALEDGLLQEQDEDRLCRTMAAKIAGAEALDRLTREDPPEVFVLFSSVSAMVGNPGQAGYAAANAYLDALAERRSAAGAAALSIGFGAILDAGMLARDAEAARHLGARIGGAGMSAEEALDALEAALAAGETRCVAARLDFAALRRELAIAGTPLFSRIPMPRSPAPAGGAALRARLRGLPPDRAAAEIAAALGALACRILRLPEEELDLSRPLPELGFDSLMAMDLRMAAEEALGLDIPLMSASGGASLNALAARAAARLQEPEAAAPPQEAEAVRLAERHGGAGQELLRKAGAHADAAGRVLE